MTTYADLHSEVMQKISDLKSQPEPSKCHTVEEEGIFKLNHYDPEVPARFRTPILIVCAWINRPYVLDLHPDISIVKKYLRAGFDVFAIDWGYPGPADQYLDLDDYADFLDKSVEFIKQDAAVKEVNLHGYCLGGTLAAAYTAIRGRNVKNLVLQAAPIDFHTDNPLALWARSIDPAKVTGAYRLASGELLNTAFLLADPINLILGKYEGFLNMVNSDEGVSSFLRMDSWIFDSPAVPGETFRQYITEWYQQNALIKGEFELFDETVDLHHIASPLLVLAARYDHIVPPESQKAIIDIVASRDKGVYEMMKGHVGISTSRESHSDFWHRVVRWLERRSEPVPEENPENRPAPQIPIIEEPLQAS